MVLIATLYVILYITSGFITEWRKTESRDIALEKLKLPGYLKTKKEMGVYEYLNNNAIIYIKPFSRGYESDHQPSVCWRGSGFELSDFNEEQVGSFTIMKGKLTKGAKVQYTAWWYDNGSDKTINQWKWRFAGGEPYRIINITSANEKTLDFLIHQFLKTKLF